MSLYRGKKKESVLKDIFSMSCNKIWVHCLDETNWIHVTNLSTVEAQCAKWDVHFPLHMPNGLHSSNTRTHTMAAFTRIIYSHRMCTPVRWLSASFICWKLYDGNVYLCAWFSARNPLENYHKYLICWLLHADQPIFNNIQSSFELFHRQPFYHLIWWFSVW